MPMSSTMPSKKGRSLICSLVMRGVSVMPGLYRITAASANSIPIHANGKLMLGLIGEPTSFRRVTTPARAGSSLSVLLYIDGSLGDLGFFDSAYAGVMRAQKELGVSVKVVQNANATEWQTQLLALAGSKRYDLIILTSDDAALN